MTSFVILHYQAIEETINCIKSIKEFVTDTVKIIVVDNNSPNGTGKELSEMYKDSSDVTVVLNKSNSGFAKGNNIGYKEAKKDNPDFIVVLNSDTLLTQGDFSERLLSAYETYNFDVLGPDIFSTRTNSHQNPQRKENYTLSELKKYKYKYFVKNTFRWLLRIKYMLPHLTKKEASAIKDAEPLQTGCVLHGAFYVFSKKFIGKHDECFWHGTFMYFESYLLHYLGTREDMTFLYYPEIRIIHHEDASTDSTYKTQYKKSVFVNKCLEESCSEFIKVMNDKTIRLE